MGSTRAKRRIQIKDAVRGKPGVLPASCPDNCRKGEGFVQLGNVHMIASLRAGTKGECLVRRQIEEVQPPAQERVRLDRAVGAFGVLE